MRGPVSWVRERWLRPMGAWRFAAFSGSVAVGVLILLLLFGMQISSNPQFCGTCHYMAPYYQSWKTSTHNTVACVECHIPPGITSELRKKYEAISMVVSYFTGTYGTNPWAEIDDAACLRCHQRRLLVGRELFRGVLFDHTPHLTEMRRGKKLRCTSCHSQIVQGRHITVTPSTCFLCHFKDQRLGEGTADCTLCHEVPKKVITKAHLSFDHTDVKRFNMQCSWCHASVIQGNGEAPKERCFTCHNDPERLERYPQTEFIHRVHVTEHKVDCLNCHLEIQHRSMRELEAVAVSCETCHLSGHAPQRDLYAGIGGKGVAPRPSVMYLAGIHCEGCHFLPRNEERSPVLKASEVSCMACHGPRYLKIYQSWQAALKAALDRADRAYRRARTAIRDPQKLADARFNLELVRHANGIHNPQYALALLAWSYNQFRQVLAQQGRSVLARWRTVPYATRCTGCHLGIENQRGRLRNLVFDHGVHVVDQALTCATCHRAHEEKPKGEVLRPDLACADCHHAASVRRTCQSCHRAGPPRTLRLADGRLFPHAFHTGPDLELDCDACHGEDARVDFGVCSDCH